jgi:hypothetical protein
METKLKTLGQFVVFHGIEMTIDKGKKTPTEVNGEKAHRWIFRGQLKRTGKGQEYLHVTPFSYGQSIAEGSKKPTIAEVLDMLVSDASLYEDHKDDIDGFADNYCEGQKISEVLKGFNHCKAAASDLRLMLGSEAYEELLYNVERL